MSTPLTPLMDQGRENTHRKVKGRTPSTASTSSKGRLYSYVSGSDGDCDDNDTTSSSGNRRQRRHWRKGSHSSHTASSSNDLDTYRMRNDQVSHLSMSEDSDDANTSAATSAVRFSLAGMTVGTLLPFKFFQQVMWKLVKAGIVWPSISRYLGKTLNLLSSCVSSVLISAYWQFLIPWCSSWNFTEMLLSFCWLYVAWNWQILLVGI